MSTNFRLSLVALLLCASISGCVSSGNLVTTRDFKIGPETKISIAPTTDPKGQVLLLESELLSAGFDVAPYELASRQVNVRAEAKVAAEVGDGRVAAATETKGALYSATYLPTAVAIKLSYTYTEYPAAIYYTKAFIRLIDLTDQKVLVSDAVDGSQWTPISMSSVIKDFVQRLQKYRRD